MFGDLENLGQLPVQEVLMILSYEFLKFLHYLCFQGQEIQYNPTELPLSSDFENPDNFRFGRTHECAS